MEAVCLDGGRIRVDTKESMLLVYPVVLFVYVQLQFVL